jgi:hypothetical protein
MVVASFGKFDMIAFAPKSTLTLIFHCFIAHQAIYGQYGKLNHPNIEPEILRRKTELSAKAKDFVRLTQLAT